MPSLVTKKIGIALAVLIIAGAGIAGIMLVRGSSAADTREWPAFVMVYEVDAAPVQVGEIAHTGREEHRLDYRSKTAWTDTVTAAATIRTRVGEFSVLGSYEQLDGRNLIEYDAVTDHVGREVIDAGTVFIPSGALMRRPLALLNERGYTFTRVQTDATVCYRDQCEQNAYGLATDINNVRYVFVDDARGIPLKIGEDSFVVSEIRISDNRRAVNLE